MSDTINFHGGKMKKHVTRYINVWAHETAPDGYVTATYDSERAARLSTSASTEYVSIAKEVRIEWDEDDPRYIPSKVGEKFGIKDKRFVYVVVNASNIHDAEATGILTVMVVDSHVLYTLVTANLEFVELEGKV